MTNSTFQLLAAACGIAIHVLYFNRYECHMHAILYLKTLIASCMGSTLLLFNYYGLSLSNAMGTTASTAGFFLAGVYGSLMVYRLFLNPLNRFPGPYAARISTLWFSTQLTNSDAYYKLQALHKKYGRVVRIGSNDLSIIDPDAMELVYGPGSKVTKSDWYDSSIPLTSMHTTRDKALHEKRRRVWAPAFSDKSLRVYEPKIDYFNAKLMQRVAEFQGGPINMTKWYVNVNHPQL